MPYDSQVTRVDAAALIPEDALQEIIQGIPGESAVLSQFRRLPNMPRAQTRIPVLSSLPVAYFVGAETTKKQTTEAAWDNKYLDAEELAVIVPVPEAVVDDAAYDIWGQIRPWLVAAFGRAIDQAVLFGTNAPDAWPDDIVTAATAANNTVTLGTGADIYADIMGEDGVIALVENDGFIVNGHIGALTLRGQLRGLRSATELLPIFVRSMQDATRYELDGSPIYFPQNGAMDATQALLISGDFSQGVYSFRQEITYKILSEAVIQNSEGTIVYNLAQQDMVALRAVLRVAWQVPNPINFTEDDEDERYPFAVLLPTGS